MDNVKIYHFQKLAKIINNSDLIFFNSPTPYSPFQNPIENIFSKWKNSVIRFKAQCRVELKFIINSKLNKITDPYFGIFYRKMHKYIIKSEIRDEIMNNKRFLKKYFIIHVI